MQIGAIAKKVGLSVLANRHGIRSVPTAIVDGSVVLSTQPEPEQIAELLEKTV